ncbi:r2d2 [Drosophila busckii]|uniref:R2d2 n=1 Tax=Drosophila busckii TaxID=30019 RepID=A0A0M3QZJ5_DROBS|nr:uncharacterized protein LOC108606105 [Drosophila busckii]ALC49489.1 r2d2 [Drosophila busckii]
MVKKSSINALQEFCVQTESGKPLYDSKESGEVGHVCKVTHMDLEAFGNGRTQLAASHGYENASRMGDMLTELRDYCLFHDMPLPTVEIVQQSGAEYSIKRFGKSNSKKDTGQRAAIKTLYIIYEGAPPIVDAEVLPPPPPAANLFKTFRHHNAAGAGLKQWLCDLYNYFNNLDSVLWKAEAVFAALKLRPSVTMLQFGSPDNPLISTVRSIVSSWACSLRFLI